MSWTDERIAVLKKMWKSGSSAADIAKELGKGVTRNAVIGKAHRMGLSGRPSPIKKSADKTKAKATTTTKKAAAKPKVAKVKAPTAKERKEAEKKALKNKKPTVLKSSQNNQIDKELMETIKQESEIRPASGGVALIDLTANMCKWPFGDPQEDDFIFCGEPIHAGTPYCPNHAVMAYQSSAKSRAAAKARDAVVEDDDEDEVEDLENLEIDDDVDEDKVGSVD